MSSGNGQVTAGRATRLVIVTIFACVFVEADASGLHGGLQPVARVGALIVALALLAVNRRRREAASAGQPTPGLQLSRQYWIVVVAEVVALVGGLVVINAVLGAHELTAPWIAVVVGVHFFGLAPLWNAKTYYIVVGTVVTVLGLAGFALHAAGASAQTLRVVSGIGSGVFLYLAAAISLLRQATATPDLSPEHATSDI